MAYPPAARKAFTAATVHLKLFPTPRSFPERREVLRVLERFGEVAMFKSLKYDTGKNIPNAFFSLFTTDAAAQDLINASPIRYRLITEAPSPDPSDPLFSLETPEEDTAPKEETLFELTASPTTFNHELEIRDPYSNPLYGPYKPVSPRKSYIAASLGNNVPKSIWAAGLKDWETANVRTTHGDLNFGAEGAEGGEGKRVSDASPAFMFAKRERRRIEKSLPRVMRGLRQLAEEREEEVEVARGKVDAAEEIKNKESSETPSGDSTTQPAPVM